MAEPGYLMILLRRIQACSPDEDDRYGLILRAVTEAHHLGLKAGFRAVGSLELLRAFIELPGSGQVSWPVPIYSGAWQTQTPRDRKTRIEKWTKTAHAVEDRLFD